MSERSIVLAERRMNPEIAQMVREVCARIALACHAWNGVDRVDGLAGRAALAIGSLSAGSRQIPADLAGLVTEQLPGVPLLLVAEEPLVRPLISLYDGLLTLLEPPLSPARLSDCVRALLAQPAPDQDDGNGFWAAVPTGGEKRAVARREYRIDPCWVGALDRGDGPAQTPRLRPWLRGRDGNVTALLVEGRTDPTEALLAAGLQDGKSANPDESAQRAAPAGLVAAVQLCTDGDRSEWIFHCEGTGSASLVRLYSALRIPRWTTFTPPEPGQKNPQRRVTAAAGDLAIAIAPAGSWATLTIADREFEGGGPALLDRLEDHLRQAPSAFTCVVVEQR